MLSSAIGSDFWRCRNIFFLGIRILCINFAYAKTCFLINYWAVFFNYFSKFALEHKIVQNGYLSTGQKNWRENALSRAQEKVMQAKQGLLKASQNYETLGLIKRNPLLSLSCAFLLGIGIGKLRYKPLVNALLPSLIDLSILAIRLGLNSRK